MRITHYIMSGNDKFGARHTLWHVGNYMYEIECRSTGNKIRLSDTTFEQAKQVFESMSDESKLRRSLNQGPSGLSV